MVDRLSKTAQNELMNIVTIFLGISVGCTATANTFLTPKTLVILAMGMVAFAFGTAGGVLLAKVMNLFLTGQDQPADRFCRRVRRADGRPRLPDRRPEGEPRQLPADARHGPQCGRCHRLRDCRRRPDGAVRLSNPSDKVRRPEAFPPVNASGRFFFIFE